MRDDPPGSRPEAEYFRTRRACEDRLAGLLDAHAGSALVGFDFAFGYPLSTDGSAVLPAGRALAAQFAELIEDDDSGANNRFDIAGSLNAEIAARFGEPRGPFWGCPPGRETEQLPQKKHVMRAVPEYRAVERHVRASLGLAIQSPWKLYTTGSVGSQTLLGLPAVHRLLQRLGGRGVLWPFEALPAPGDQPDGVVVAEIWPSLYAESRVEHPIRDARQVSATRDALFALDSVALPPVVGADPGAEGWIAGLAAAVAQSSRNSDSHTV